MVNEETILSANRAQLQSQSLQALSFVASSVGYVALMFALWPQTGAGAGITTWLAILFLVAGSGLTFLFRNRYPRFAAHLFVWSLIASIVCAALTWHRSESVTLLTVPVICAAVVICGNGIWLPAATSIACALAICLHSLALPLLSLEVWLPVAAIILVALASWLSARNLNTALDWLWSDYQRANQSEQVALERQGELRRVLKALDETTYRLERANLMLDFARNQAEQAERMKQRFAQMISHELRTPLNLIVGFTHLMMESPESYGSPLPLPYRRDLATVHRNAYHLQSLINDVLDLARIEAAQMTVLPQEVEPARLVREAVATARGLVELRRLSLEVQIEPDLPRIWVDPTRIRQVLLNLINNAVRFTEQGGITISVARREADVVFAVRDTGTGIPEEDLPHLFGEFYQVQSIGNPADGTGLGLAISRHFVELHGGRIWAESQTGQGSTFYFRLGTERKAGPLTPVLAALVPTAEPDVSAPGRANRTAGGENVVLTVSPSGQAAALLEHHLRRCRTVFCNDLEQARQVATLSLPQVVVIDAACGLDVAALAELSASWGLLTVPFVVCPLPGEEPLRRGLEVEGYLIKPVTQQSLWDVLRQFGSAVDRVLVVDDDRDFTRLLSRMLDNPVRRYEVASAAGGHEGLQLARHFRPDLILLDLLMPDMHGAEFLAQLRSDPTYGTPAVVVVSGEDAAGRDVTLSGTILVHRELGWSVDRVLGHIQAIVDLATLPPAQTGGSLAAGMTSPSWSRTMAHDVTHQS